ncbi:CaeNaCin (Caenorhabditis bacteriocin) [Trichostrongylus colubriformis]|uniref:CaeNaCin (Caenorhabditis bacteriocin) n=1 Tax=Trichostrongylus colubriformis TaxID=6319 RepID=A0AAN8F1Z9_TRICO
MNFFATIVLLIVCIASIVSSTAIREKRQFGYHPYGGGFGGPGYGGFGRPYYGGYNPYGGYGGFRRGPTVIEKTVIIRG